MRQNRVKKVMREGKLALCCGVSFADPREVEIIGLAGYDAARIDMEHTHFDLSLISDMIMAADLAGVTSIVRVPENDPKLILRLLDMGAEGISIPHVDGLEGAKRAVDAVRYEPLGHRGHGSNSRATRFGNVPWREHVRQSNDEVLLYILCEDEKGIRDMEKIAALDGVDIVAIGFGDFSEYMGIHDPGDPRLRAELYQLADRIKQIGKAKLSYPIGHKNLPLTGRDLLQLGVGFTSVHPTAFGMLNRVMKEMVQTIRKDAGLT
jgi:2-keto-3-deoxy-L-rhamnonate aldolase RhmA